MRIDINTIQVLVCAATYGEASKLKIYNVYSTIGNYQIRLDVKFNTLLLMY